MLILVGFLPSEVWRWLGILMGRGLDENSETILWVRGVATALIASGGGAHRADPAGRARRASRLSVRLAALGIGFLAFLLFAARHLPAYSSARRRCSRRPRRSR